MKKLFWMLALVVLPAHALTTYDFTYEGTSNQGILEGTLALTVPDGVGTFGNTSDGYSGVYADPNIDVHILMDGKPLFLSGQFTATIFESGKTSFYGPARILSSDGVSAEALFVFNGLQFDIGKVNPDRSATYGHAILTAVPEPETWVLMFTGLLIGVVKRRRRFQ